MAILVPETYWVNKPAFLSHLVGLYLKYICFSQNTISLTALSTCITVFYTTPPWNHTQSNQFWIPSKSGQAALRKMFNQTGLKHLLFEINISLILMILKPYNFYTRHPILFNNMYTRKSMYNYSQLCLDCKFYILLIYLHVKPYTLHVFCT
jgi:hypothetical protein